jgi:hypothetical protein
MAATQSAIPTTEAHPAPTPVLPRLALGILLILCALKLLLHAFTSLRHYGYFRDELYYLDMGRHLAFGYVDAAPLVALYAKIALLMGGSLAALRILPALAGAALIALTILLARQLGGSRFAQLLAGLAILLCPGILAIDSFLSMNAFEPLFWMAALFCLLRFIRTGHNTLWLWLGLCMGLGFENKHSTIFFAVSLLLAILLTPLRREFRRPWIWLAIAIALALFLPNLLWQFLHHFPTLEDLSNVRKSGKNVVLGPLAFIEEQFVDLHPVLILLVALPGLVWLLRQRRWRVFGLLFLVFFLLMELAHAKAYYLFPIYPILFAAGGVALEQWLSGRRFAEPALVAVILLTALPFLPIATWMLPPEQLLAYQQALHFQPARMEVHQQSILPQPIADQFGWPELVHEVADIYNTLPPGQRAVTGIWAGNYGEAGAIDLFGPRYGLPNAWSRHQNYWFWGPPPQVFQNLIVIEWSLDDVRDSCTSYQAFPHFQKWGMAEENTPIYLCRGVKFNIQKIWSHSHHWN